jgi:hypothetical protein
MRRALLVAIGLSAATAVALFATDKPIEAADHTDAPGATAAADMDILDLFAWMDSDAGNVNLALTVNPFNDGSGTFSRTGQYVFHVNSSAGFGMAATETLVVATFDANDEVSVWVGDGTTATDYVSGDASATAGLVSTSGDVRVYAGVRNDPFFFDLNGFVTAVGTVRGALGALSYDTDGCPLLEEATANTLRGQLAGADDSLDGADVSALVIQIDKSLLNGGGDILGVWASTHN